MIGLSESLAADLTARGYTDSDVAQLFAPQAWKGEIRVIYRRHPDREDFTSPLPSSRHMDYIAKGWTAVAIEDPPAARLRANHQRARGDPRSMAATISAGVWRRGTRRRSNRPVANAQSLLSKGWTFAGLADEARRRAVGEARLPQHQPRQQTPRRNKRGRAQPRRDGWMAVARVVTSRWSDGHASRATARARQSDQVVRRPELWIHSRIPNGSVFLRAPGGRRRADAATARLRGAVRAHDDAKGDESC